MKRMMYITLLYATKYTLFAVFSILGGLWLFCRMGLHAENKQSKRRSSPGTEAGTKGYRNHRCCEHHCPSDTGQTTQTSEAQETTQPGMRQSIAKQLEKM